MKRLSRWFINGLVGVLPISVTLYVTWLVGTMAENTFGAPLQRWLGVRADATGYYFYGLGLCVVVVALVIIGLFLEFYFGRVLMSWGESLLQRIPGVKQIYSSIKEILDFFNPEKKHYKNSYMVVVTPLENVKFLGYVTRDTMDTFRDGQIGGADEVVVIIPFCYQMGGNCIIVPRTMVKPLDISFEDGLKIALSGFVLSGEESTNQPLPPILDKILSKKNNTTMRWK